MKKLYSLDVRGNRKKWSFQIWADPKHVEDWRGDGLRIEEIVNTIPEWWVNAGFSVHLWCFFQDLFNPKR